MSHAQSNPLEDRTMTRSIEKFGCTLTVATLLAVGLGFSGAAQAGDAAEQAQTAADHAGYAAGSDGIDSVHAHLHHALNCLVGPNGEGFDASFGYPCDGMGSGALNDADMDHQTTYLDAIAEIKGGLATDDVTVAQTAAVEAGNTLSGDAM
jgi:hypothetical protein